MLYAKVVLGLPVEGPFDYIVATSFYKKIKVGARVRVSFGARKAVGYVVKLTKKTNIKNLKSILEVIDDTPILDKNILSLTKELSDYYCCSWGEAIETALPQALREGKSIEKTGTDPLKAITKSLKGACPRRTLVSLLHDLDGRARWDIYLKSIKETLDNNGTVIVLMPDINSVFKAKEIISANLGISPAILYRKESQELEEWLKIKQGRINVVAGTRSAIFAPLNNLGLVIIDDEPNPVYKQDQVPHYHAREVAFMRINIEKAKLILGSATPSLETIYLARKNKINYTLIPRKKTFPEIKIADTHRPNFKAGATSGLSKYLQDLIFSTLTSGGKTLLFLNRRGFATFVSCRNCAKVLRCPRCNISLVYHFKENILSCHYCNFRMLAPNICPNCNASYIRYSGSGTEKIESELSRIFPQAAVKILDKKQGLDSGAADIFIATQYIIKEVDYDFDLTGVLLIDNSLNRIDFRSTEKVFGLLVGLLGLTKKTLVIQTRLSAHHCFQALLNKDINIFYDEELKTRKQLKFPPYQHFCLVKLRGKKEERVKEISNILFERLNQLNKNKAVKILSVNSNQPAKLRDNFYWQILIRSSSAKIISGFLKIHLKDFPHSGIIVTVDIDPV